MRLSAPKKNTFYVSVALAVLAILGEYFGVTSLASYAFELLLVGFVVLAAGNYFKGF